MKTLGYIVIAVLSLDFLGFIAWVMSGQLPVDTFYVGMITRGVLSIIS